MSIATVSRVLRDSGPVSPETRTLVMTAVEELGYRPNPLAQGLRRGRSNAVALVISDIEKGWYASLTKHLQVALERQGVDLILMSLGHEPRRLDAIVDRVQSMRLRGMILAPSDRMAPGQIKKIVAGLDEDLIVVSIGQRLDRYGIPSFVQSDTEAARAATEYLLSNGRWPIAFCSRIKTSMMGRERFQGYREAIEAAGLDVRDDLVWDFSGTSFFRQAAGYEMMIDALDRGVTFGGLLAGSDEIALGAMAAALDRRIDIPGQLAIIGFGGLEWGVSVRPTLTTMSSDISALVGSVARCFGPAGDAPAGKQSLLTVFERQLVLRASA